MLDKPDTRVGRLRAQLALSQAEFGARIGQSQSTVDRLEAGQPETGPQKLLLDILERDIAEGRIVLPSAAAAATSAPRTTGGPDL